MGKRGAVARSSHAWRAWRRKSDLKQLSCSVRCIPRKGLLWAQGALGRRWAALDQRFVPGGAAGSHPTEDRGMSPYLERVSCRLTKVLRHKARRYGIEMRSDGFAPLAAVVPSARASESEVRRVIASHTQHTRPPCVVLPSPAPRWPRRPPGALVPPRSPCEVPEPPGSPYQCRAPASCWMMMDDDV